MNNYNQQQQYMRQAQQQQQQLQQQHLLQQQAMARQQGYPQAGQVFGHGQQQNYTMGGQQYMQQNAHQTLLQQQAVQHQQQMQAQMMQQQQNQSNMMAQQQQSDMLGGEDFAGQGNNTRSYRKRKFWPLNLNITIETPDYDNKLNESFQIEIGSNQRLKILKLVILSHVKNDQLRELIKNDQMYIYIEGKEPVARKSKSLAEMGVQDNDNLIVTTEMKLPITVYSSDDDDVEGAAFADMDNQEIANLAAQGQNIQSGATTQGVGAQQNANQRMMQQQQAYQQQVQQRNLPVPQGGNDPNQRQMHGQAQNMMHQQQQMRPQGQFQQMQGVNNQQHQGSNQQQQAYNQQQRAAMAQAQQNQQREMYQQMGHGQNQQNMGQNAGMMGQRVNPQQQQYQNQMNQGGNQNQMMQNRMQGMPGQMQGMNPNQLMRSGQPLTEQQKALLLKQQQEMMQQQKMGASNPQMQRRIMPTNQKPNKDRKREGGKSPSVKRTKEVHYIRLRIVQQYFKGVELKADDNKEEAAHTTDNQQSNLYAAGETENKEDNDDAHDEKAPENGKTKEGDNQDGGTTTQVAISPDGKDDKEAEETAVDDRGEEAHVEYQHSEVDEAEQNALYDPNEIMALDINSRSKVSCLKKLLLEKRGMKKANIILMRQVSVKDPNAKIVQPSAQAYQAMQAQGMTPQQISQQVMQQQLAAQKTEWVEFTKQDFDKTVKDFENQLIGFKIYLDVRVHVEGRGHTFQQHLQVDPKDQFEKTMRTRTLMWNTFMNRGLSKCIIMVQYKGKDDYIPPNDFDKSFEELKVLSGAQITLVEMKKIPGDMSEGEEMGEDEMEDMEDEMIERPEEEAEADKDAKSEAADEGKKEEKQEEPAKADEEGNKTGEQLTAAQQLNIA